MNIKEKVRDYQQKRKAKKYFRSHNQYVIHAKDLPLYIITMIISSITLGGISAYIEHSLPIMPLVLYLIIGVAIAEILYRVSGIKSKEMGILAVISCLLTYIFKSVFTLMLVQEVMTFSSLINNSLLGYLFMFAGCYVAYIRSNN